MSVSILIALTLAGLWLLVNGEFTAGHSMMGVLFGTVFVLVTGAGRGGRIPLSELPRRGGYLLWYLFVMLPRDLIRANVSMARTLLRFEPVSRPGIVRVPMQDVTPTAAALEQHAMTVAPGQMLVEYVEGAGTAYVHLIDVTNLKEQRENWQYHSRILARIFS